MGMELESDLDTEARKSADVLKQARKADKRVKEVEFALEDERKASEKAHDGLEKMHSKMKHEIESRRCRSSSVCPPDQIQESHPPTRRGRGAMRDRRRCPPEGPTES